MSKHVELQDNLLNLEQEELVSLVENLLNVLENIGYAYDIDDKICDEVSEVLYEYEVDYKIVEEDI